MCVFVFYMCVFVLKFFGFNYVYFFHSHVVHNYLIVQGHSI